MSTSVTAKLEYLKQIFGAKYRMGSDGVNASFVCPNKDCDSRKAGKLKYVVRLNTDQSHCWVCGLKTSASLIRPITMVTRDQGLISLYNSKFRANARTIAEEISHVTEDYQPVKLPADFRFLLDALGTREGTQIMSYLKRRHVTERDIWRFKIGMSSIYPYQSRVLIPSFDVHGEVNYFVGRSIDDKVQPKYVNPDVDKLEVIVNEHHIDWSSELTIVEGIFDLIKCSDNATSLQGSNFGERYRLCRMILKHKTPVLLALDADVPSKTERYAKMLSLYDIPVRILQLGPYKDVGEMSKVAFQELRESAPTWSELLNLRRRISRL